MLYIWVVQIWVLNDPNLLGNQRSKLNPIFIHTFELQPNGALFLHVGFKQYCCHLSFIFTLPQSSQNISIMKNIKNIL